MTTAEATGLLAGGRHVELEGLTVLGPGDAPWVRLAPEDHRARPPGVAPNKLIIHSTWGGWPHVLVPGAGPRGGAKSTAWYWHSSPDGRLQSGAAPLVVDEDGSIVCLGDVERAMAYHATTANERSVGIEMYQRPDGRIRDATLEATVRLALALCTGAGARYVDTGDTWLGLGIPFQVPGHVYRNAPIERMRERGGPDMAGIFGHRDVAWRFPWQLTEEQLARFPNGYSDRGRGDPGDDIGARLRAAGAEAFDFDAREDLVAWRRRQVRINLLAARRGERWRVVVDGIAGPQTLGAIARLGFACGRDIDDATD